MSGFQIQRLNAVDKWVPCDLRWVSPCQDEAEAVAFVIYLNSLSSGRYLGPNAKRYRYVKLGWN